MVLDQKNTRVTVPVVRVSVSTPFETGIRVAMPDAEVEGPDFPKVCSVGSTSAVWVSATHLAGKVTKGKLEIDGFEPVSFAVSCCGGVNTYVTQKGRFRQTFLSAARWDWRQNADKPTEGIAADVEILGGSFFSKCSSLSVTLREATEMELKRCLQLQALRDARLEKNYDELHGQISKARVAGVEWEHISQAEEQLKEFRKQGLHIDPCCQKEVLREAMVWSKITPRLDAPDTNQPCKVSPDCPCNVEQNEGEVVNIIPNVVQDVLKEFGAEPDKELFQEIVDAALALEEGSVWRAGGKYIFSALDRNQAVIALIRTLNSCGKQRCSKMLLALLKHAETIHGGFVSAVQLNIHPDNTTYHDQHRDIYSAKQRAGPNCTCSFREAIGTVCYTLGSSRPCRFETMTDESSNIEQCCETCESRHESRWFHSGSAMFFNSKWNISHTHGIPCMDEPSGPRISIAFLLGAEPPKEYFFK